MSAEQRGARAMLGVLAIVAAPACSYDPDLSLARADAGAVDVTTEDAAITDQNPTGQPIDAAIDEGLPEASPDADLDAGPREDGAIDAATEPTVADARLDGVATSTIDGTAGAAGPLRLAYAFADQPAAARYTAAPDRSFNGSGQPVTIERDEPGRYRIRFEGLAAHGDGRSSAPAVTTYETTAVSCSVAGYEASEPGALAKVECRQTDTGALADGKFAILFVGDRSVNGNAGFVVSGGPPPVPAPDPAYSWDALDRKNTVGHAPPGPPRTGFYEVFAGSGNVSQWAAQLVTSVSGARCQLSDAEKPVCFDETGRPNDRMFSYVWLGAGRPGGTFDFARAVGELNKIMPQANPSPPVTVSRTGGDYTFHFPGRQLPQRSFRHVQVTPAYGAGPLFCSVVDTRDGPSPKDGSAGLLVSIACRTAGGQGVHAQQLDVALVE